MKLTVKQQEICEEEFLRHGKMGVSNAVLAINKKWQRKGGYKQAVREWFKERSGRSFRRNKAFTFVLPRAQKWAAIITANFLDLQDQIDSIYS